MKAPSCLLTLPLAILSLPSHNKDKNVSKMETKTIKQLKLPMFYGKFSYCFLPIITILISSMCC